MLGEIGMGAPPEPCERRVLRAAARVACRYSMSVIVHVTGGGLFGIQAIEDCADEGLSADRVILGHLDERMDRARHADLVGTGATIALDTWGSEVTLALNSRQSEIDRMRCLAFLLEQGLQNQIVLGQEVFLKVCLHELVGNGYEHFPAQVLPRLEQYGVPEQVVEQMVANPRPHLTCYPPLQPGPGPAAAIPPPRVTP